MSVGRKKRRDRRRTAGEERRAKDRHAKVEFREDDVRPSPPGQAPARLGGEFGSFGVLSKRFASSSPLVGHCADDRVAPACHRFITLKILIALRWTCGRRAE